MSALAADVDEGEGGRLGGLGGLEEDGFVVAAAAAEDISRPLKSRVSIDSGENHIKPGPGNLMRRKELCICQHGTYEESLIISLMKTQDP